MQKFKLSCVSSKENNVNIYLHNGNEIDKNIVIHDTFAKIWTRSQHGHAQHQVSNGSCDFSSISEKGWS